jgi:hypothetical protein
MNIKLLILCLISLYSIYKSKLIKPTYNFGNKQNYHIDLLYNHLLGNNLYFFVTNSNQEQSQFSITLYPSLSLIIKFKIYTSDSELINALENGKYIYFGLDLNITNTDITLPKYNTDVIICVFDKNDASCYDYVFDKDNEKYLYNNDAAVCKNNLIPLGFDNIQLNILTKNVMEFENYYSVDFIKSYPDFFDNITMFNWINYVGNDMEQNVSGFYGITDSLENIKSFSSNDTLYYKTIAYEDGSGISDENIFYLSFNKFVILFIIMFIIF